MKDELDMIATFTGWWLATAAGVFLEAEFYLWVWEM